MSEDQVAATPTQETPPPSLIEEVLGEKPPLVEKEDLYIFLFHYLNAKVEEEFQKIAHKVKEKSDLTIKLKRVFGKDDARDILTMLMDGMFEVLMSANSDGTNVPTSLGIPGGFGAFQLGYAKKTRTKTPQGNEWIDVPKRWRVSYKPGKRVIDRIKSLEPPIPDEEVVEENSENPSVGD